MPDITVWLMRHRNKDGSYYWLHNHVEDGHSHRNEPIARSAWQKQKWSNQKWIKIHSTLNEGVVLQ